MQQEDDLRGLAKVMDFMRALSILFVVINIYWYCYQQIEAWGINVGVIDRILLNFDRTAGLFHNILWTKLFAVVFLVVALSAPAYGCQRWLLYPDHVGRLYLPADGRGMDVAPVEE